MNKMILIVALISTVLSQNSKGQNVKVMSPATDLLTTYYHMSAGLVKGNAVAAGAGAQDFVNALNSINKELIPDSSHVSLLNYGGKIASSSDVKKQREYFAKVSEVMIDLAKATKLTTEPVYKVYCPMKKAAWLSASPAIRNPYYGSAMLTCGKVSETIK